MIRMGRSSKTDKLGEIPQFQEPANSSSFTYQNPEQTYFSENVPSSTRAVSESESMARDIKEGRLSGFVGNGTMLTGETTFQAMLRVDGHLTGRVASETGTLVIGATGRVDANILVAAAVINGTINGDVVATERIELGRTARVIGNLQTPSLRIEEGAIFEGNCSMLKSREASDKRFQQKQPEIVVAEPSMFTDELEEPLEESVNISLA